MSGYDFATGSRFTTRYFYTTSSGSVSMNMGAQDPRPIDPVHDGERYIFYDGRRHWLNPRYGTGEAIQRITLAELRDFLRYARSKEEQRPGSAAATMSWAAWAAVLAAEIQRRGEPVEVRPQPYAGLTF